MNANSRAVALTSHTSAMVNSTKSAMLHAAKPAGEPAKPADPTLALDSKFVNYVGMEHNDPRCRKIHIIERNTFARYMMKVDKKGAVVPSHPMPPGVGGPFHEVGTPPEPGGAGG